MNPADFRTANIAIADTDDACAGDRVRIVNPEGGAFVRAGRIRYAVGPWLGLYSDEQPRRVDEYPARYAWRGAGWMGAAGVRS